MWKPEYSVGVGPIDDQHQRLFHLFGLLMDSIHSGETESTLDRIFVQLRGYVTSHFRFEERLMRKAGYPALEEHEGLHDKIRENLCEFRSQFNKARDETTRNQVVDAVVVFMNQWLVGHILGEDQKYMPHMDNPEVQKLASAYYHDEKG
ncbi:MAG: hemerythrin family protein [Magnetococcales bacterium]|nr:hemerythrin family protein [Magnetococcales bacterium]NGZ05073.1 hemerythrin family protein [Magnetococcales bacterium]